MARLCRNRRPCLGQRASGCERTSVAVRRRVHARYHRARTVRVFWGVHRQHVRAKRRVYKNRPLSPLTFTQGTSELVYGVGMRAAVAVIIVDCTRGAGMEGGVVRRREKGKRVCHKPEKLSLAVSQSALLTASSTELSSSAETLLTACAAIPLHLLQRQICSE